MISKWTLQARMIRMLQACPGPMKALPLPEETAVLRTAATSTIVIGEPVCEHESVNTVQRIASAAPDLEHSYMRAAGWQCLGCHV